MTDLEGGVLYNSISSLLEYVNTLSRYQIKNVFVNTDVMVTLVGISGQAKGFITKQSGDNYFDFFLVITNGSSIYAGRYNDGSITAYKVSTSLVNTT